MPTVRIEDVERIADEHAKINRMDLSKIKWTRNGKEVKINKKVIEDFGLYGLSNMDFILSDFYERGANPLFTPFLPEPQTKKG